jgi:MFS family permease
LTVGITGFVRAISVFRAAFAGADLRRVELAFIGFNVAEYGTWIAVMVFAYRVGGTSASGVVGAAQLVPAALLAPFASFFGDRYPRNRVLVAGYLAQALTMSLAGAAMVAGAPVIAVYALAAAAATAVTLTRPVQGALLPALSRTPEELVAANVAAGWIEGASICAGPLLTGALLAFSTPGAVFLVMAALLLGSALLAAGVTAPTVPSSQSVLSGVPAVVDEMLGGFRAVMTHSRPRLVVGLMGANFLLLGAVEVLMVVLSIRVLGLGSSGVGYLMAAFGLGGLVGAICTTFLATRQRLAPVLFGAGMLWAVGFGLVALGPGRLVAPVLIVISGAGRPLIDVIGRILLQRVVPNEVLSRAFGVLEGLAMAAEGLGMLTVPVLVLLLHVQLTFAVCGALLPLLTLILWRGLRGIDATHAVTEELVALLRSLVIFAPLPVPVLLRLAGRLVPFSVPAGATIIQEGRHGDRFYVIRDGQVGVTKGELRVDTLRSHDFFGEIALLRDIPRTASVMADTDTSLYALDRQDFLEAVTGHPQSMAAADDVSRKRLGEPHAVVTTRK